MRSIFTFLLLFSIVIFGNHFAFPQGCVAIRQYSGCGSNNPEHNIMQENSFLVGMNYRYFKSFRHFRGKHEEPDRLANATEVINYSNAWDFNLLYSLTDRLYFNFSLPMQLNERSSLYEHGRNERNTTFSRGIGDIRLGAGYWLLDPEKNGNGNLAVGLSFKLPTGNYNASDIFYNVGPSGEPEVRPVDQSIQPGDGGFGVIADFQLFRKVYRKLYLYGNGFYLFNPRETNGIRTFRETLSPVLANEAIMSVPDQYSMRGGFLYALSNKFSVSMGYRYDCVPVEDVFGGSDGFRRPGSVSSFDPGISYMHQNLNISFSMPFAVVRNRPQSVTDLETEQLTGNPRNGDAAFADYVVNFSIAYQFNHKKKDKTLQWNDIRP